VTFIVAAGCAVHEDARVVGTLLLLFCVRDLLVIAKFLISDLVDTIGCDTIVCI